MVVLRLIGDEWAFNEKIAIALPPAKSFNMFTTQMAKLLSVPQWTGLCLYYSEGKPPNYCRATVPVPMNSNPGKEGLKDGTILYVKVGADGKRQQADRIFHESLLAWRKENNIASILSDGSDVFEFIDEFSSRLNPAAAEDINDFERERRGKLEGEEHREYFMLTYEYREIQQMKDEERDKRAAMAIEWEENAMELFATFVLLPRQRLARVRLIDDETQRRGQCTNDEGSSRTELIARRKAEGEQIEKAAAALALKQQQDLADAENKVQQDRAQQQQQPNTMAGHSTGGVAIDASALQQAVRDAVRAEADELRRLAEAVHQEQRFTSQVWQQQLDEQGRDMVAREADWNRRYKELSDWELSLLQREKQMSAGGVASGPSPRRAALQQQNDLLRQLIAEEENQESRALIQHAELIEEDMRKQYAELQRVYSASTAEVSSLKTRLHLSEAARSSMEQEVVQLQQRTEERDTQLQLALEKVSSYEAEVVTCQNILFEVPHLHPEVQRVAFRVVQSFEPIPARLMEWIRSWCDPSRLTEEYARQCSDATEYFDDLLSQIVLQCGASADMVSDVLCQRYRILSHPQREAFRRSLDEHQPHLSAVVDLLTQVYQGREAELLLMIIRYESSEGQQTGDWVENNAGDRSYYYHPAAGMSQWLEPLEWAEDLYH